MKNQLAVCRPTTDGSVTLANLIIGLARTHDVCGAYTRRVRSRPRCLWTPCITPFTAMICSGLAAALMVSIVDGLGCGWSNSLTTSLACCCCCCCTAQLTAVRETAILWRPAAMLWMWRKGTGVRKPVIVGQSRTIVYNYLWRSLWLSQTWTEWFDLTVFASVVSAACLLVCCLFLLSLDVEIKVNI